MDLNIGAALWLAARGAGTLHLPTAQRGTPTTGQYSDSSASSNQAQVRASELGRAYVSQARVVFVGHGADEVFCGYGRHRTAFKFGGLARLQSELEIDMRRLWLRNLGRDDRIIADNGREARHPFLDEALLAAVAALPLRCVADLRKGLGVGDKAVLRGVAARLGLAEAATRHKRAIQFGSRIGRLSNVRDFGSNRAANRAKAGSIALPER